MSDVAKLIVGALWFIFLAYWLISAIGTKRTRWNGDLRFEVWFRVALIVLVVALSREPVLWRPIVSGRLIAPTAIVLPAGIAICALGLGIAAWARVHLGVNWGMPMTVRENPDLVTSGPYSLVRHPIYTGVLVAQLGTALVFGNALFVLFVSSLPYLMYCATKEEKLMTGRFPDQYREYKSRTKMLIPFVL